MIDYCTISTSFPVVSHPEYLLRGGHSEQGYIMLNRDDAFKSCPFLQQAHKVLLSSDPIGRIGNYKGVYELGLGVEAYTPDLGSDPGEGVVGVEELMRIITFTTYYDAKKVSDDIVGTFIENLAEVHPWEHPVIKLWSKGSLKLFDGKNA